MEKYIILTDSSCDLPAKLVEDLGIAVVPLSVRLGDTEYMNYLDEREIAFSDFYKMLRAGSDSKTSAVNVAAFIEIMDPLLSEGQDILYIGFASSLSNTYNAGAMAAVELREKYPERKIYTVDSLCASLGQGLLIYLAAQQKNAGGDIGKVRDYAEGLKMQLCHWFTVDDLNFLHRGGRVSKTTATVGTMLNIKPVMHLDNEGHLTPVTKVRGRKASLRELVNRMAESAIMPATQSVFISHGDCLEDAQFVADLIQEKLGAKEIVINYVGPVIGSHSGPGTVALFFIGNQR